jgi:predicted RNase H-like HicB family nuclease
MRNACTAVFAKANEGGGLLGVLSGSPSGWEGETVEACAQNLREAILLMLEDRREDERKEAPAGSWEHVMAMES